MRKLLPALFAVILFAACNNNAKSKTEVKTDSAKSENKEAVVTPVETQTTNTQESSVPMKGWSSAQQELFVKDCVTAAVAGKMDEARAKSYCDCVRIKMEEKYATLDDANKITEAELNSEAWMAEVMKCLGQK